MDEKRINLYSHQGDAYTAKVQNIAIMGGVGSGKSFALMLKLIDHCFEWAGTTAMIVRAVGMDVRRVAWGDFVSAFGEYISSSNRMDGVIQLLNGSQVVFLHGWDDERGTDHLDGFNISCFLISQAEQCPADTWRKLLARSRRKNLVSSKTGRMITDGDYLRLVEGNPAERDWVYDEFVAGAKEAKRTEEVSGVVKTYSVYTKPDHILVNCESADYSFVPVGYVASVCANAPARYVERYIKGKWLPHSGLVYGDVITPGHWVEPYRIRQDASRQRFVRIIGFDWGLRDPTGIVWAIYDREEDCYLCYRESYRSGLTIGEQAKLLVELTDDEEVDAVIADTQIWSRDAVTGKRMVEEMEAVFQKERFEAPIHQAAKDIEHGVNAVTKYLKLGKIAFFSTMKNTKTEFDLYRYPEDLDRKPAVKNLARVPLDKNNHVMDAIRYIIFTQDIYRKEMKPVYNEEPIGIRPWDGSKPAQATQGMLRAVYNDE